MTRSPGYVLVVDPEMVDAGRFEQLVGEAGRVEGAEAALTLPAGRRPRRPTTCRSG